VTPFAVLLCAVGGVSSVEVVVNHFEDGIGTAFGCSTDAEQCNLRSAWLQCHASLGDPCFVRLPSNSYHTFNATIGQLELERGSVIAIIGNSSTITSHAPPAHEEIESEDFPLETGLLSNTNSASQNFASGCVEACPLDLLRFSSCDGEGDTYISFFDSSEVEVAWNDDGCGALYGPSVLTYVIPENGACQLYCLHVGCFGNQECSANVTVEHLRAPQAPARLISFRANNLSTEQPSTSLALHGLVVQGFSAPLGGVLYSSGDLNLTV
jgi:hypothetical protein